MARHVRAGQVTFVVVALVCAGLGAGALWGDDKSDAAFPLMLMVAFAVNVRSWEVVGRHVRRFDAQHSGGSGA